MGIPGDACNSRAGGWITIVNCLYLLVQVVIAAEGAGLPQALRASGRFVRAEYRDLGGVFLVILGMAIGATLATALAWSGVGLVAFVPLVGLAVFPLQIIAFHSAACCMSTLE